MRATKPPAWTGRGLRTQPALGSSALSLPKLSKLPSSEAVCLQLDGSSASPACLLCFLILSVGLSKSRAEPPRDQGEAGGPPVPSSFFIVVGVFFPLYFFFPPSLLCTQSWAMMKLQFCLAHSIHARHMLEIIVLGGALQTAEQFN